MTTHLRRKACKAVQFEDSGTGNAAKWRIEIDYDQEQERMGTAGALGVIDDLPDQRVMGIKDGFR